MYLLADSKLLTLHIIMHTTPSRSRNVIELVANLSLYTINSNVSSKNVDRDLSLFVLVLLNSEMHGYHVNVKCYMCMHNVLLHQNNIAVQLSKKLQFIV